MVANSTRALRPLFGVSACLAAASLVWLACDAGGAAGGSDPDGGGSDPTEKEFANYPPTAVLSALKELREDLRLERDPSDGGGKAWLESGPEEVVVSTRHTWTVVYEAGPLGVAPGGMVYFMTSPFWGWDDHPQSQDPRVPGYTVITTDAEGVELEPQNFGSNIIAVRIGGRALEEGERIRFEYGADGVGAVVDKYYERDARFWLSVDGDGDGVRKLIADSPAIDVLPGPPSGLWMTVPTTVKAGETARVALALMDGRGNAWVDWEGDVVFVDVPDGVELPERVSLAREAHGVASVEAQVASEGLFTLHARLDPPLPGTGKDFSYESNPMLSSENSFSVLWADLHGHSQLSDGTGTPEDYYRYARDVAALDIAVLTDHDHWGITFLDQRRDLWDRIRTAANEFYDPGHFVSLLGYEWTSWIYGHRHVIYFTDDGELFSSMDPATENPAQLWDALRGKSALTFAHHSAGGPIATDWSWKPDPEIEPVTEIVSVHGSSEAADSPDLIYHPVPGNFVRDVLDRGMRFGFVGSGDSHDGHPGLAHIAAASGGLAAILAEDRTRESVLEALRARRVYATNGSRILLRASLGGLRMGATVPADAPRPLEFRVHVIGTAPIKTLEIVRSGEVLALDCEGEREVLLPPLDVDLQAGEYLYVRVTQEDGGLAWSSPFYAD